MCSCLNVHVFLFLLQCGLALHRKCMEMCQLECEHRKGTVFGVDLSMLPRTRPDEVPFVVLLCTSEIESRALSVQVSLTITSSHWPTHWGKKRFVFWPDSLLCFSQGVYRVSGSKPRIQKLCQAFETQKRQVDLSDHSPHDITSILKHFFKEVHESCGK